MDHQQDEGKVLEPLWVLVDPAGHWGCQDLTLKYHIILKWGFSVREGVKKHTYFTDMFVNGLTPPLTVLRTF